LLRGTSKDTDSTESRRTLKGKDIWSAFRNIWNKQTCDLCLICADEIKTKHDTRHELFSWNVTDLHLYRSHNISSHSVKKQFLVTSHLYHFRLEG
jgi:hypothetical protein